MQNPKTSFESIVATARGKDRPDRTDAGLQDMRAAAATIKAVDNSPLQGWRFWLFNAVLALGNIVVLSNVPGYTSVAPYVAGSLGGVSPSFGSWATTDHMVGLALGLPFARWLSARFGGYRVYTVAFVLYAFTSLLCASSETLWLFLPGRIALGFVGGVILPIGQSLALGEVPERYRTVMVGFWGVLSMTPFTIGVAIATWYAEFAGWRMMFVSNIVVSLLVAGVVAALLYRRGFSRNIARFDVVGCILLVATVYGAQTLFNMGNDFDWLASPILQFALAVVAVALPSFIIWELAERRPVLDLRLFAHRNYAIATACSVFGFLVIQGLLSLEIGQLQLLNGYSSSLAGLVYLGMIILAAPLVSIMHELNRKIDVRLVSFFCFIGLAANLSWFGMFDKLASFDQIFWPFLFYGFFIASFFAPLAALAMQGLSGSQLIRAAEELAFLRTVAGSFGISLMAVIQFRRLPFHQLELADHLGGRRFASLDLLGQFAAKLQDAGVAASAVNKQLGKLMREQSALLGLNDVFLFGAAIFVALAVLVWFARPTPIAPFPRKDELRRLKAEELMEQP
jgi:MFS transporter, DHA2 family, multidrug resistance protein